MGQSTNAILFYGYSLGEDFEWPNEELKEDPDEYYAKSMGVAPPEHVDYDSDEWSAYWDAKQTACEASGCGIGQHCSGDYPIYFVHAKCITSYRGDETGICFAEYGTAIMTEQLKRYAAVLGLPFHEPQWLLVSYWG